MVHVTNIKYIFMHDSHTGVLVGLLISTLASSSNFLFVAYHFIN